LAQTVQKLEFSENQEKLNTPAYMPIVALQASGEAGFLQRLFPTMFSNSLGRKNYTLHAYIIKH
jgi:hypothetical protein